MKGRISKVGLTAFRGATVPLELDFDTSKAVVVIFGENGTGKSTIVDAIGFVAEGSFGSIEGCQSTPAKEYLPALGSAPSALRADLRIGAATWRATLHGARPSLEGPEAGRPSVHVLRRSKILSLLMAAPADRYKELARFVDVPRVESAEEALRKAVGEADKSREGASAERASAEAQLEHYWADEQRPGATPVEWARGLAAKDTSALEATAREAAQVVSLLSVAEIAAQRLRTATAEHAAAMEAVSRGEQSLRIAEDGAQAADALLMAVLERAEDYLVAHPDAAECPVCEKPLAPLNPQALRARLADRRRAGQAVDVARKALEASRSQGERAAAGLGTVQVELAGAGTALFTAVERCTLPPVSSLALKASNYALLRGPASEETRAEAATQAADLTAGLASVRQTVEDFRDKARGDMARLTAVRRFLKAVDEQAEKGQRAEHLLEQLQGALAVVERRRKRFVGEALASVAGRVGELYAQIHPGEDVGEIALTLDPKKRRSLSLTGRFQGVADIPPEGYYSESHLDTLGICVFLAIAERSLHPGRPNVLVLDDVLTSVDGPHLDRFMAVVQAESENFDQVIVTTHYRHWFENYKRGQGPAKQVQLIELSQWSLAGGMRADCSPLPVDQLAALLVTTPLDRQGVASRAGVILETVLTHLSHCYRVRLPASKLHQHTLSELCTAVRGSLRNTLESRQDGDAVPTSLEPIIRAIEALTPFRNWVGAHYNPLGDGVPNAQVLELGTQALALTNAVTCLECGEMAGKRAGTHWRCHCGKKTLSPLAVVGQQPPGEDVIP